MPRTATEPRVKNWWFFSKKKSVKCNVKCNAVWHHTWERESNFSRHFTRALHPQNFPAYGKSSTDVADTSGKKQSDFNNIDLRGRLSLGPTSRTSARPSDNRILQFFRSTGELIHRLSNHALTSPQLWFQFWHFFLQLWTRDFSLRPEQRLYVDREYVISLYW